MHAFLEQINQTHTSQLPLEITCRLLLRTVILLSMDWQLEPFREQEVILWKKENYHQTKKYNWNKQFDKSAEQSCIVQFSKNIPPQALNCQSIPAIVCFSIPDSTLRVINWKPGTL